MVVLQATWVRLVPTKKTKYPPPRDDGPPPGPRGDCHQMTVPPTPGEDGHHTNSNLNSSVPN